MVWTPPARPASTANLLGWVGDFAVRAKSSKIEISSRCRSLSIMRRCASSSTRATSSHSVGCAASAADRDGTSSCPTPSSAGAAGRVAQRAPKEVPPKCWPARSCAAMGRGAPIAFGTLAFSTGSFMTQRWRRSVLDGWRCASQREGRGRWQLATWDPSILMGDAFGGRVFACAALGLARVVAIRGT